MNKTIREAIEFAIDSIDRGGVGTSMAKLMLENVLVSLENGKTLDDEIKF